MPTELTTNRQTDADARYAAALGLVQTIDRHLQRGTCHYRDGRGRLLVSLEETVRAILKGDLVTPQLQEG